MIHFPSPRLGGTLPTVRRNLSHARNAMESGENPPAILANWRLPLHPRLRRGRASGGFVVPIPAVRGREGDRFHCRALGRGIPIINSRDSSRLENQRYIGVAHRVPRPGPASGVGYVHFIVSPTGASSVPYASGWRARYQRSATGRPRPFESSRLRSPSRHPDGASVGKYRATLSVHPANVRQTSSRPVVGAAAPGFANHPPAWSRPPPLRWRADILRTRPGTPG